MPGNKFSPGPSIHPGDAGIWATCDMHREGQCTAELKDLFNDVSTWYLLYIPHQFQTSSGRIDSSTVCRSHLRQHRSKQCCGRGRSSAWKRRHRGSDQSGNAEFAEFQARSLVRAGQDRCSLWSVFRHIICTPDHSINVEKRLSPVL